MWVPFVDSAGRHSIFGLEVHAHEPAQRRAHANVKFSQRNLAAWTLFFAAANMFSDLLTLSESTARPPKNIFDSMSAKGHRRAINTMSNVMQSYKAVQECVQSGSAMWRSGAKSDQRTLSSQNTGEDRELVMNGRLSLSSPPPPPRKAVKGTCLPRPPAPIVLSPVEHKVAQVIIAR